MLKVLGKLGQLARLSSVIDDLIVIGFHFLAAKEMIEQAMPGEVLDVGDIKGAKVFGRVVDLPLRPHVR